MPHNIGNTEIIEVESGVFVKLEYENPTGSIKDRAAFFMLKDALNRELVKPGGTVVEASSGNTGIGLAYAGNLLGLGVVIAMPDFVSKEKVSFVELLGGKAVLTDGRKGMPSALSVAKEIAKEKNAFLPDQFSNPANALAHELGTGPEILSQMHFDVDAFVAGVGTGGTLIGVARALKKFDPGVSIFAVEPEESAVLSGGKPGTHTIEGIGAGFVPELFDESIVNGIIRIPQKDAWEETFRLCKEKGICGGPSTGANVLAAREVKRKYGLSSVATVAPDGITRYLSEI